MPNKSLLFEIDDRLIPVLEDTLAPYPNVTVVHQDILKTDLQQAAMDYFDAELPLKVVANLPYHITTPIMMHFWESELVVDEMVVMMQKRSCRSDLCSTRDQSIWLFVHRCTILHGSQRSIYRSKTVFVPQPNVDSAILKLTRRAEPAVKVTNEKPFSD